MSSISPLWLIPLLIFVSHSNASAAKCEALMAQMPAKIVALRPFNLDEINYEYFVNPEAIETIVLIHRMDGALKTFLPILPELKKRFHVLLYDPRGHDDLLA